MQKFIIYIGPHMLDLVPLQGQLVDYQDGGLNGLRPDLPGFKSMALSLADAMPLHGATAGISQDVYDHFVMCNQNVDMIDERLALAMKQVEVLKESRAHYVDARQNDVALMVDAMRSRAKRRKDDSILIPFEKVLAYYSQIGDKAHATRKKNEEAQAAAEGEVEPPPPTEPGPAVEPVPPVQPAPAAEPAGPSQPV